MTSLLCIFQVALQCVTMQCVLVTRLCSNLDQVFRHKCGWRSFKQFINSVRLSHCLLP